MSRRGTPSFARLALLSLAGGVAVLAVSVPIVLGVSTVSPLAALIVALLAIVVAIAVIGIISTRIVNGFVAEGTNTGDTNTDTPTEDPRGNDEN